MAAAGVAIDSYAQPGAQVRSGLSASTGRAASGPPLSFSLDVTSHMNADRQANIETMAGAISETLFSAWSYFHLLEGFHNGSKSHPVVVQKFDRLFDQLWRAVFDGLFSKAGTLIDRTKNTYSIPHLVTMVIRYGESDAKSVARSVQARLNADDGPLKKIESWRHEVVAHRTPNGRADIFYKDNKMNLPEIADGLRKLEQLLNELSLCAMRVVHDTETGSLDLVKQGTDLFGCVANHAVQPSANTQ